MFKLFYSLVMFLIIIGYSGCVMSTKDVISKQDMQNAIRTGIPIVIHYKKAYKPNSAGGIDARIDFVNISSKTIKYINFTVLPYNNVGDIAPSEIGGKTFAILNNVGPFLPNMKNNRGIWRNIWYNHSIKGMKVSKVNIIYMDGSEEDFKDAELSKILLKQYFNYKY